MSLLTATDLSLSFGGQAVLEHVSIAIEPGEIVTLVGPNGSGKSTLVKTLIGLTAPDAGRITRKPGLRLGYVPQKLPIDATLPMTGTPDPRRADAGPRPARRGGVLPASGAHPRCPRLRRLHGVA